MQWFNHRIVTATFVYAATGSIVPTVIACQGSIIPDSIEGNDYNSDKWKENHRKISHFWLLYLLPAILCYLYLGTLVLPWSTSDWALWARNDMPGCILGGLAYLVLWLCIGALCHLAEDFICGGVPLLSPKGQRVGVRLFYVKSHEEYRASFILNLIFLGIAWWRFS